MLHCRVRLPIPGSVYLLTALVLLGLMSALSVHYFIGTKDETEKLLVCERWDFLCKQEMVGEEGAFVIGCEEVLTEEELATTLKVQD